MNDAPIQSFKFDSIFYTIIRRLSHSNSSKMIQREEELFGMHVYIADEVLGNGNKTDTQTHKHIHKKMFSSLLLIFDCQAENLNADGQTIVTGC